jgi:hypothetical protein
MVPQFVSIECYSSSRSKAVPRVSASARAQSWRLSSLLLGSCSQQASSKTRRHGVYRTTQHCVLFCKHASYHGSITNTSYNTKLQTTDSSQIRRRSRSWLVARLLARLYRGRQQRQRQRKRRQICLASAGETNERRAKAVRTVLFHVVIRQK